MGAPDIAAFGGDPGRVTIAGQSGRRRFSGFLSISPLARGLFQSPSPRVMRAIPAIGAALPAVSWRPLQTRKAPVSGLPPHAGAFTPELRAMPWERLIVRRQRL